MIQTKQFNKIPASMLPELKRDEVAVFVSLMNSKSPADGSPLYPTYGISSKATIMTDDGPAEIAFVTADAPEGRPPALGEIIFESSQKGTIVCKGSSPTDVRKFQYMMLHPDNEANGGSVFRREIPGQQAQKKLDKAKVEKAATDFAIDSPIDAIKSALKERGIGFAGKSDDDIRLLALDEGKKKPFATVSLIDKVTAGRFRELYEAGVYKWDNVKKCVIDDLMDIDFTDAGIKQTDSDKPGKLLEAASRLPHIAEAIKNTIEEYDNIKK